MTAIARAGISSGGDSADDPFLKTMTKVSWKRKREGTHGDARRKRKKPRTMNEARSVARCLDKQSILHPLYKTTATMWDEKRMQPYAGDIGILPIHETLDAMVEEGQENQWCSFDEN